MPFGLKNAASTFQRYTDKTFQHVDCVFTYIDDILIFSDDSSAHIKDVESVIKILHDNNLKISITSDAASVNFSQFFGL